MDCEKLDALNKEFRTAQLHLKDIEEGKAGIYGCGERGREWWIESEALKKTVLDAEKLKFRALVKTLEHQIRELVMIKSGDSPEDQK